MAQASNSIHPTPAVQLLGAAVLLQGGAMMDVRALVKVGLRYAQSRDGIATPPRLLAVLAALDEAAEQLQGAPRSRQRDATPTVVQPHSELNEEIGTREAAIILGITARSTQRLAQTLDGTRLASGAFVFRRSAVEAYAHSRQQGSA